MQRLNLTSPYELVFKGIHNPAWPRLEEAGKEDGSFLSHHLTPEFNSYPGSWESGTGL